MFVDSYTVLHPVSDQPGTRKRSRARQRRTPNWQSKNRGRTGALQRLIHDWLDIRGAGMVVSELAALLGISRQLCLYHLKKMAATSQLVMALEPCQGNGGLQFHIWANRTAAAYFLARAA